MGLLVNSPAGAAITAFWQPVTITPEAITNDPALANMQSWDLVVNATGDWSSAGLRATLATGEFYNHHLAGNTTPHAALILLAPAAEFDTYVTAPSDGFPGFPAPPILGGFPSNERQHGRQRAVGSMGRSRD